MTEFEQTKGRSATLETRACEAETGGPRRPANRSSEEAARRRDRRAIKTGAAGLVVTALSRGIQLLVIPLSIRMLGLEQYGLWLVVGSLVAWGGFDGFRAGPRTGKRGGERAWPRRPRWHAPRDLHRARRLWGSRGLSGGAGAGIIAVAGITGTPGSQGGGGGRGRADVGAGVRADLCGLGADTGSEHDGECAAGGLPWGVLASRWERRERGTSLCRGSTRGWLAELRAGGERAATPRAGRAGGVFVRMAASGFAAGLEML